MEYVNSAKSQAAHYVRIKGPLMCLDCESYLVIFSITQHRESHYKMQLYSAVFNMQLFHAFKASVCFDVFFPLY